MADQMNILINAAVCTGCRLCELACSMVKEKEANPAKARIYNEFYLMEGMRVPRVCVNCEKPACVDACPTGALARDAATGWVSLDTNQCNMCLACTEACPYGALRVTRDNELIKCDLCKGDPECVKICEIKAITYGKRQPQNLTKARKGVQPWDQVKATEQLVR